MPLDSPKYRSFFTCDDSKGVAKCKTSRKSKTGSHKSEDLIIANKSKSSYLKVSISYHHPGKETLVKEFDDTCCKGRIRFGMKSKDVAQDLLRGALDLHHSLQMFGMNLQDKAKSKSKPKDKEMEMSPHLFGNGGRRPPEFSAADGNSKDCYDQLRDAITEGLAKQNLLPKTCNQDKPRFHRFQKKSSFDWTKEFTEQKGCLDKKNVFSEDKACFDRTNSFFNRTKSDLSVEFPSTSSDQSSMFHSREFDPSDTSFQWSFEENDKGRNVIAKLMGLQEKPPKSLSYGRPIYDVDDLPKSRKSLQELIQTVQFKELVMISPVIDVRSERQRQLKSLADDSPPIVIIKPLHVTGSSEEGHDRQKFFSLDLDAKEIIRKLKMKAVVPSRTPKAALDINELGSKLQGEMSLLELLSHEKGDVYCFDASKGTGCIVQTKQVTNEKGHNAQKLATNASKSKEGDIDKTSDAHISRNTNIEHNALRDHVSLSQLTAPHCSNTRKKKAKPEKQAGTHVAIQSNPCYDQDLSLVKLTTLEEVADVDQIEYASKSLDDWNKTESNFIHLASVMKHKTEAKSTKDMLLGNPLFVNKVEELFYTNAYQPSTSRTSSSRDDINSADEKHLLDCAKELLENKSLQSSTRAAQRFSHALTNKTKNFIFLDQLVTEVCDGMEDLSSYRRRNGEKFAQDTLPKVLQKDLWCKGVVNGGWDLGWTSGFTSDEVDQIVVSIQQQILTAFIEDTIADMLN